MTFQIKFQITNQVSNHVQICKGVAPLEAKRFEILKELALSDCQATIADTNNDIHVLTLPPC